MGLCHTNARHAGLAAHAAQHASALGCGSKHPLFRSLPGQSQLSSVLHSAGGVGGGGWRVDWWLLCGWDDWWLLRGWGDWWLARQRPGNETGIACHQAASGAQVLEIAPLCGHVQKVA